jgi:hypothetical protein
MVVGPNEQIEYIAPDGSGWRAALSEVQRGLFPGSSSDPEFLHFRGSATTADHQGVWIRYKSTDGRFWTSRCHSHADPSSSVITFTFENCRLDGKITASAQFSTEMAFLDWDGNSWVAKVGALDSPGSPVFILRKAKTRRPLKLTQR